MHTFVYYTALIIIFRSCQKISHNFKNQELTDFDFVLQSFILCGLFYKMVRLDTMVFILYQLLPHRCSLLHNQN